jgi:DNA (cytosine-5)-methyltransferase 1
LTMVDKDGLRPMYFIDLFAGCGGLSLGLMKAGWRGLFAIEKSPLAFETLRYNLVDPATFWCFDWPGWLPVTPFDVVDFLEQYSVQLEGLRGQVMLVAGGPPCQGFSFAGRRNNSDRRNRLVNAYLDVVELVQPDLVLLENVRGITVAFKAGGALGEREEIKAGKALLSAADEIKKALDSLGYYTFDSIIKALIYGVPQHRPRYIMIAGKKSLLEDGSPEHDPFITLAATRQKFLRSKGLPLRDISVGEAISDLKKSYGTVPSPESKGFQHGLYGPCRGVYQRFVRVNRDGEPLNGQLPDSHRFANHRETTVAQWRRIMRREHGKQLSASERERLGVGKHAVTPLARTKPSHTLTTLPDDLVHYSEPRILTVRESARLQSFPDWFVFRGKYTTGAQERREEVPRYTQVGNAVSPLMAEGIGYGLMKYYFALVGTEETLQE